MSNQSVNLELTEESLEALSNKDLEKVLAAIQKELANRQLTTTQKNTK